jgi:hypothetical protein
MSRAGDEAMLEACEDAGVGIRQQLAWHLGSNHYPPVPSSMIDPCIAAIMAAEESDYDSLIALPKGVSWRGNSSAPARAIIEGHHLEAWVNYEE